jgi:hypothetical protein
MKRKESALKTINAHFWKIGTVAIAFALAFVLMIASSPSTKTAEAAACVTVITAAAGDDTDSVSCRLKVGETQTVTVVSAVLPNTATGPEIAGNQQIKVFDVADGVANANTVAALLATGAAQTLDLTINGKATVNGASGYYDLTNALNLSTDTWSATRNAYTTTFTVTSAVAGVGAVSIQEQCGQQEPAGGADVGACDVTAAVVGTTLAASTNTIYFVFENVAVDCKDNDLNGKCSGAAEVSNDGTGAQDRSFIQSHAVSANTTGVATVSQAVNFNVEDVNKMDLKGVMTFTLGADSGAATFTNSGTKSITVTTSQALAAAGVETVSVAGLPATGNFRYDLTGSYVGQGGTLDLSTVIYRTDNKLASLTATHNRYKTSTGVHSAVTGAVEQFATDDGDVAENGYVNYITLTGTDSAGNPAAATVNVTDGDGTSTKGLGALTGVYLDIVDLKPTGNVATSDDDNVGNETSHALGTDGVAYAILDITSATDCGTGCTLTFKDSLKLQSADVTITVRGAAKTYTLTGPDNVEPGAVAVYTIQAYDANGHISDDGPTVTPVSANSETGGTIVPSTGNITLNALTGGTLSVIAPRKGGTGTLAIVAGGKVVASKSLTYNAAVTGVALSGTGCTGDATGSYTCVVSSGGTAAEVATASGAASIWQSDADGVLQGYVVGTPDFVDTGLASTAAIADNSAIIVVR